MMTVSTSAQRSSAALWRVRLVTLALAALAAASVVFWALKISAPAQLQLEPAALAGSDSLRPDAAASARALGATPTTDAAPAPAVVAQRWSLSGVARAGTAQGVALIAADGERAKPYRLKARLQDGLFLVALEPRKAHLGPTEEGPISTTLELPKRPEP